MPKKSANDLYEEYKNNFKNATPLIVACEKGKLEDVKTLMSPDAKHIGNMTLNEYVNQFGTDSRGEERTPLMIAAYYEHFQIVKYLIGLGADANIAGRYGANALHYAAGHNEKDTEVIELLLTNMSLNSINNKSVVDTPLDRAYGFNDSPIRQKVIELIRLKGGQANVYNLDGKRVGDGLGDLNTHITHLHFRF